MAEYQHYQEEHIEQEHVEPQLDHGRTAEEEPDGPKRKRDEQDQHQRSKRSRYTTIACNECKRRKIKCNGEAPCQRCHTQNLPCLYSPNCCSSVFRDTNEYKQMNNQINDLQGQVDTLWHHVNNLRAMLGQDAPTAPSLPPARDPYAYNEASRVVQAPQAPMMIDPALSRGKSGSQHSRGHSAYANPPTNNYDLARSSLQTIGLAASEAGGAEQVAQDNQASGSPQNDLQRQTTEPNHERALADLLHTAQLEQHQMAHPQVPVDTKVMPNGRRVADDSGNHA